MYSDANGQNEITRPTPIAAQHHFEVIYAKEATCTEMGYNVVGGNGLNHCLDCGKYFKNNGAEMAKEEVELPALGHDFKDGKCTRCGTADSTPTHTHSWETVPAVESTCTDTGLTEGIRCSECGEWQKEQTVVPKKDHTPETIAAVSPTCTEDGKTEGKKCVIVGRSNIVGKPMGMMMIQENATVTIAHSKTADLPGLCRSADILITAVGRAKMFGRDYIKPGAVVIDCGMNRDENGKLCGDVDYEDVYPVASAITPVPGGVGPMTVAMLMKNCLDSARIQGIVK